MGDIVERRLGWLTLGVAAGLGFAGVGNVSAQSNYERTKTIEDSYSSAFCRPPKKAEINYWLADPQSVNAAYMTGRHRDWLKSQASERREMVKKSYLAAIPNGFSRSPQKGEATYWESQVAAAGYTCEELKAFHGNWQAQNPGWIEEEYRRGIRKRPKNPYNPEPQPKPKPWYWPF